MRPQSAKTSARTQPRRWVREEWRIDDQEAQKAMGGGEGVILRPRSAPGRRKTIRGSQSREKCVYHIYTGHRVRESQYPTSTSWPSRIRKQDSDGGAAACAVGSMDKWSPGRVGVPLFGRSGPKLTVRAPTRLPTRPEWPTPATAASVRKYLGLVQKARVRK
ncbi:unnamed protein product [Choristocarpus tenellus]